MVYKFNSYLNYKKSSRLLFIDKFGLTNSYGCPSLENTKLWIDLKSLENFDSSRLLAAVFILRILGGSKPYIIRFNLFQTFHEKKYDARVVLTLGNQLTHSASEMLSIDVLPFLAKVDLSAYAKNSIDGFIANFTIADLSFIRVVETHSIFFKWHDKVNIRFAFNLKKLPFSSKVLLSAYHLHF